MIIRELVTMLGYKTDKGPLQEYLADANRAVNQIAITAGAMTAAVVLPTMKLMQMATAEYQKLNTANKRIQTTLASTGRDGEGVYEGLQRSAEELTKTTHVGGDVLLGAANALLRYGSIGGEMFKRVQVAGADFAAGINRDVVSATDMLGRALEYPLQSLTLLRQAGIVFSESEQKRIEQMVQSGRLSAAQAMILERVEKKFKGQSQAQRDATNGAKDYDDALGAFLESIGELLLPMQKFWNLLKAKILTALTATPRWLKVIIGFAWGLVIVLLSISTILLGIVKAMLLLTAGKMLKNLSTIGSIFKGWAKALWSSAKAAWALVVKLAPVIAAVSLALAMVLIIQDFIYWLQGKKSLFGDMLGTPDELMEKTKKLALGIVSAISEWFDGAMEQLKEFWNNIRDLTNIRRILFGRDDPVEEERLYQQHLGVAMPTAAGDTILNGPIHLAVYSPDSARAGVAVMDTLRGLRPAPRTPAEAGRPPP